MPAATNVSWLVLQHDGAVKGQPNNPGDPHALLLHMVAHHSPLSSQFKYGVISTADLLTDLRCWNTLYASGRLHKPVSRERRRVCILDSHRSLKVKIFKPAEFQALEDALKQNLHSAAVAALLMLPQQFTEFDLYTQIAGLSYTGHPGCEPLVSP